MNNNYSGTYSWLHSDPLIRDILRCTAEITQLSIACIARIEDDNWTSCAVYGNSETHYKMGDQADNTINLCDKLGDSKRSFVIGSIIRHSFGGDDIINLRKDDRALISVPINRTPEDFVGVLFAQGPRQQKIFEESMIRTMQVFAELISLKINSH